ncbi:MAG: L-lactate dehydrogenase [Holophagales bacterium]|jgi:L-lactate dehydrogenase|nr:L-lactate dehydrogenase [Holophagales bacterium]
MTPASARPVRVAVVGAGSVGSTFAYALVFSGLASEIVLVDANVRKAEGEALDLQDTIPFARASRVEAGPPSACAGAAIVVVTAGTAQKPGETRLDLMKRNAAIFRGLLPEIVRYAPDAIVVIAANPVDVLTHLAVELSGLPSARIIGSGTILDTARFRVLLGRHLDIDPQSVHAWVVGEHGDSEVPVWSGANVAGMSLAAYAAANGIPFDDAIRVRIAAETRDAAARIIARKGSTYYAIGAGLLRIVEAILRDERAVLSVSTPVKGILGLPDVCLSLPAVVGRGGVETVLPLELAQAESSALGKSAEVLRAAIERLGEPG